MVAIPTRLTFSVAGAALGIAIVWAAGGFRAGSSRALSREALVSVGEGRSPARDARWRELLDRARTLQERGNTKEAIGILENALAHQGRRGPPAWLVYGDLARYYVALGRYDKAESAFKRAKGSDKIVQSYIDDGYAGLSVGHEAEARRSFGAAIAVDTGNPLGYFHLGHFMREKGQLAQAERLFRKSLGIFKSNPGKMGKYGAWSYPYLDMLNQLESILVPMGRLDEAEALAREGIAESADYPPIKFRFLRDLSQISAARGEPALVEKYYRRAMKFCKRFSFCDPGTRIWSQIHVARFYVSQGRREDAIKLVEKSQNLAMAARKSNEIPCAAVVQMANLWAGLGAAAKAERMYRSILRDWDHGGRPRAHGWSFKENSTGRLHCSAEAESGLARLYCGEGRDREAADLYGKAEVIFNKLHDAKASLDVARGCRRSNRLP